MPRQEFTNHAGGRSVRRESTSGNMQVKSNAPSLGQTPMLRAVLIKRLPGIQAPGGRPIQSVLGSSWEHPRQFSVLIRCICQRLKQASLLMASYTTHALLPRKPRATGKCLTLRDGLNLQWVTSHKHQADLGHFSWTQHDFGTRARSTEHSLAERERVKAEPAS
jgi:hypothetical protein